MSLNSHPSTQFRHPIKLDSAENSWYYHKRTITDPISRHYLCLQYYRILSLASQWTADYRATIKKSPSSSK